MSLTSVGIVVALKAEAAALTTRSIQPESVVRLTEDCRVWLSGMGPDAAGKGALALVDAGATALMTFGVAGALDNDLRSGALLCPQRVLDEHARAYPVNAQWRDQLIRQLTNTELPRVFEGALLSVSKPLFTAEAKTVARNRYHAVAVDMESAAVAAIAEEFGLPFLSLRAVVDEWDDEIPSALHGVIDPWGQPQRAKLIRVLARQPWLLTRLPGLAAQMNKALAALSAAAPIVCRFEPQTPLQRTDTC